MRIRFMNPHAQSKDPSTPTLSQPLQGVLPHLRQPSPLRAAGVNRVCIHLVYILSCTSCHPERSLRIRFMNPHAQSKDPCTPTLSQPLQGVLPHLHQPSPLRELGVNRVCIHLACILSCTSCHPERSMRIRFMNPHAQSKDPCTPTRSSAASGSSPKSPPSPVTKGARSKPCLHTSRIHLVILSGACGFAL